MRECYNILSSASNMAIEVMNSSSGYLHESCKHNRWEGDKSKREREMEG